MTDQPRYILYHGNCPDGWGAAWAAWTALGDSAEYIPCLYGQDPPRLSPDGIVLLVDFSYPRDVLLRFWESVSSLEVLDHHKTAEADLAGLDWCLFDMDKSGAMLTWEWFHPHDPAPAIIQYVQDRDLWRFALPDSREVYAWMSSYPRGDFGIYQGMVDVLEANPHVAIGEGKALLRLQAQYVETMCQQAFMLIVGGYRVPVVNATTLFSEVGDRLCELYPDAPFAAYYLDRADGNTQWGLRSRGEFDVSEVAMVYGGGGHRNAAGFTLLSTAKVLEGLVAAS